MVKSQKKKVIKVRLQAAPQNQKNTTKKQNAQQEITAIGRMLRSVGGIGGGALGSYLGAPPALGTTVGTGLGALISKWLGQGDYTVSGNSLVKQTSSGVIPAMHSSNQTITVRHKEFLTSVTGSQAFNVGRFFLLQPGDTNTFPWLSGLAHRFQQYRIKGMVFHYIPSSGIAVSGTNPALGTVMIQTTYRANDASPASKAEMMNEYWASEAAPSEAFCHPIECSPRENPFMTHYIRTVPVPSGETPMMYDLGKTFIATQGMPADGNVVGDLWVTYEIELSKPNITSSVSTDVISTTLYGTSDATHPLGTAALYNNGVIACSAVNNTLTFPIGLLGEFVVTVMYQGSATAYSAGAVTCTNCVATGLGGMSTTDHSTALTAGAGVLNKMFTTFGVLLSDPSSVATVTVANPTITGTTNYTVIYITRYA